MSQPTTHGQPAAQVAPPQHAGWILAAVTLGSGIAFLDGTVVNVALPRIQTDFNAAISGIQWILDAYTLLLAALLLVGGALGDLFGRKRVFLIGLTIFALASAACGLAPSLGVLIFARAVQGVGGALLVPESLAIITAVFPAAHRGQAIGVWAAFSGVTSALGPLVGGYLITAASWRWAFFINLPLALLTWFLMARFVPETRSEQATGHIDWPGAATITLGLAGIIFGVIEGPGLGWSNPLTYFALLIGVAGVVTFLFVEAHSPQPMLPLGLFRSRQFSGTNAATLAIYFAFSGVLFFLSLYLQETVHYSPFLAGLSLAPITLISLTLSRPMGWVADRFGPRLPMTVGPMLVAIGFLLFLRISPAMSYLGELLPALIVLSLGIVVTVTPLTTAAMSSVDARFTGVASGVNNAVARVAGALAIAALGAVAAVQFGAVFQPRVEALPISQQAKHALLGEQDQLGGAQVPASVPQEQRAAVHAAIDNSFTDAFRLEAIICAVLAFLGGLTSLVTIPGALLPSRAIQRAAQATRASPAAG